MHCWANNRRITQGHLEQIRVAITTKRLDVVVPALISHSTTTNLTRRMSRWKRVRIRTMTNWYLLKACLYNKPLSLLLSAAFIIILVTVLSYLNATICNCTIFSHLASAVLLNSNLLHKMLGQWPWLTWLERVIIPSAWKLVLLVYMLQGIKSMLYYRAIRKKGSQIASELWKVDRVWLDRKIRKIPSHDRLLVYWLSLWLSLDLSTILPTWLQAYRTKTRKSKGDAKLCIRSRSTILTLAL